MISSWKKLLRVPEGLVLLTGVGLALVATVALAVSALWCASCSQLLVALTATNLIFGRVAAMSFGYAVGLDDLTVIVANLLIETLLILLFYPLFVFSWQRLVEVGGLRRYLSGVGKAAERHRETIRRYGIVGLFFFVWSPFWLTGPVVGCAVGFLLGLPMRVTLTVVLAGTCTAVVGWAFVMRELHEQASRFSALGPLILYALLALAVVVGYLMRSRAHHRSPK